MANIFGSNGLCKDTNDFLTTDGKNCADLKQDEICKDSKIVGDENLKKDKELGLISKNCCACGKGTNNNPDCVETGWKATKKSDNSEVNCKHFKENGFCKDRYFVEGKREEADNKYTFGNGHPSEKCCECGGPDRLGFPALNEEGCPFDYPYRTRFKEHKDDNYKYCYKKKECLSKLDKCNDSMRKEVELPNKYKGVNYVKKNNGNCKENNKIKTFEECKLAAKKNNKTFESEISDDELQYGCVVHANRKYIFNKKKNSDKDCSAKINHSCICIEYDEDDYNPLFKDFVWPPLNDENCDEEYPYRTTLKKHKSDKFRYCYKEKDCAIGKKKCSSDDYTDKYPEAPSIWPQSEKQKKESKKAGNFFNEFLKIFKKKEAFGGRSNKITLIIILVIFIFIVRKWKKKN